MKRLTIPANVLGSITAVVICIVSICAYLVAAYLIDDNGKPRDMVTPQSIAEPVAAPTVSNSNPEIIDIGLNGVKLYRVAFKDPVTGFASYRYYEIVTLPDGIECYYLMRSYNGTSSVNDGNENCFAPSTPVVLSEPK